MFINKFEREHYLYLIGSYSFLNEWLEADKISLNPEEKKYLKTAGTFMKKALAGFINRIDPEQRNRLTKQAKNNYISLMPTRTEEPEEQMLVKAESVYDLANYALYHMCQSRNRACITSDTEYKSCELFQTLMDLNIPLCNAGEKGCPYKILWDIPKSC